MAETEDVSELLFFDTFSHESDAVNNCGVSKKYCNCC